MAGKDYYAALGVSKTSSEKEIKKKRTANLPENTTLM